MADLLSQKSSLKYLFFKLFQKKRQAYCDTLKSSLISIIFCIEKLHHFAILVYIYVYCTNVYENIDIVQELATKQMKQNIF